MAAVSYATLQPVYFGHPAPGQIPLQATVFGFPQHLVPRMGPITQVIMPQNTQSSMRHGQRMGARHGATSPHIYLQQQVVSFESSIHQPFMCFNPHNLPLHPASKSRLAFHTFLVLMVLASCAQRMIHPNASQGIRYMPNARNAAYPAMLPQGFPSAMPSPQQAGWQQPY